MGPLLQPLLCLLSRGLQHKTMEGLAPVKHGHGETRPHVRRCQAPTANLNGAHGSRSEQKALLSGTVFTLSKRDGYSASMCLRKRSGLEADFLNRVLSWGLFPNDRTFSHSLVTRSGMSNEMFGE